VFASLKLRNGIPLRGSGREAHIAVGGDTLVVEDDFESTRFLIAEDSMIGIVKEEDAEAVGFEGVLGGELQRGCSGIGEGEIRKGEKRQECR
jgi:hypothetical protein